MHAFFVRAELKMYKFLSHSERLCVFGYLYNLHLVYLCKKKLIIYRNVQKSFLAFVHFSLGVNGYEILCVCFFGERCLFFAGCSEKRMYGESNDDDLESDFALKER
jgi:hypothetical protein